MSEAVLHSCHLVPPPSSSTSSTSFLSLHFLPKFLLVFLCPSLSPNFPFYLYSAPFSIIWHLLPSATLHSTSAPPPRSLLRSAFPVVCTSLCTSVLSTAPASLFSEPPLLPLLLLLLLLIKTTLNPFLAPFFKCRCFTRYSLSSFFYVLKHFPPSCILVTFGSSM